MQALSRLIIGLIQFPVEKRPRRPLICRNGNGILTGPRVIFIGAAIAHILAIAAVVFLVRTR